MVPEVRPESPERSAVAMTTKPALHRPAAQVIPLHRDRTEADVALVVALRAGDPGAGQALFVAYGPYVRRVLMRVLGPDPELGDLAQDVFLAALESISKLENAGALRGWLAQIAVFHARKTLRRRKQWTILRFFSPEEMPVVKAREADFEASEALRATYRVLAALPVDERIAFTLRIVEGMELVDAAAACRVSLATIKRRIARAEARFAEIARGEPSLDEWIGGGK
jgi:RNA polymerase sigma-70 factor (ECF subfamily)